MQFLDVVALVAGHLGLTLDRGVYLRTDVTETFDPEEFLPHILGQLLHPLIEMTLDCGERQDASVLIVAGLIVFELYRSRTVDLVHPRRAEGVSLIHALEVLAYFFVVVLGE